jgi:lysophospholipid acyltransferase
MISDDQIRVLSSMLACIPLSYFLPKIGNVYLREIYSIVLGTVIQFYIYGKDLVMVFALHAVVYGLVMANRRYCGTVVTTVSLALLSVYHVYRMMIDYGGWSLDISTIMMCNVNKYSFFAFSYQDGLADASKLTK